MSNPESLTPPPESQPASSISPPPTKGPKPTGNTFYDSIQSAVHITEVPCARNSLLAGIASGAGMGVIRGLSSGPMMAGNWAVGTFMLVSIGSWHICQKQFADERKQVAKVIEAMPRRSIKRDETNAEDTKSASS